MGLSEEQIQRYSRHVLLPGVGGAGQERLLTSSVLVAYSEDEDNAASVALIYLAAAGVGRIGRLAMNEKGEPGRNLPLTAFLGCSLEDGIWSLNPDAGLVSFRTVEEAGDAFEALLWLGKGMSADFERLAASANITLVGVSRGETGEVAEDTGSMGELCGAPRDGGAHNVATQGAMGAWMAAKVLRRLLDAEDTVGSTAQARFDFSHGLLEARANLS